MDDEFEKHSRRIRHLIKHGDIAAIRDLLDSGLDPNFSNKFGWTPLMQTASEGNTALGELLIAKGADVNFANSHGQTAFTFAVFGARIGFIKLLLDHGAIPDRNLTNWITNTYMTPNQRETVLAMVCRAVNGRIAGSLG